VAGGQPPQALIFSALNAMLLRPLPFDEADRLVRLFETEAGPGLAAGPGFGAKRGAGMIGYFCFPFLSSASAALSSFRFIVRLSTS
jgi:hypothetical protein